jgi:hypothetical protein
MWRKAFTLLLAAVVLWASVSTQEAFLEVTGQGSACLATGVDGSAPTDLGSVADHHLDDQPVQPPGDGVADHPAMPSRSSLSIAGGARPGTPIAVAEAAHAPPDLDGPHRPPRNALTRV